MKAMPLDAWATTTTASMPTGQSYHNDFLRARNAPTPSPRNAAIRMRLGKYAVIRT